MSDCPACALAQTNGHTGLMYSACQGCVVREIANSPKSIREQYYSLIVDPAERESFIAAVNAEFARRRAMAGKVEA